MTHDAEGGNSGFTYMFFRDKKHATINFLNMGSKKRTTLPHVQPKQRKKNGLH